MRAQDIYYVKLIDEADYFVVTQFCGRGVYKRRARCATREEASQKMAEIHLTEPRARLMLYAIHTKDGRERTIHVG